MTPEQSADWLMKHFKGGWPGWKSDRQFLVDHLRQQFEAGRRVGYVSGYVDGGEKVKALVLAREKCFRHQEGVTGMVIQIEGFIEPNDVREIRCNQEQVLIPKAQPAEELKQ